MSKNRGKLPADTASFAILAIGIIFITIVLTLIVRVQRGLLGIILAGLAVVLLVYWLREIRKTVNKEWLGAEPPSKSQDWAYDIIDGKDDLTVVAEVPGPEDQVKVDLTGQTLEVKGGQNFKKTMKIPKNAGIIKVSYVNRVLNIKLRKLDEAAGSS
ncbi:MAG: hypothetical protein ABIH76_07060 [Candidatus Bathyarchaeota archaeon]